MVAALIGLATGSLVAAPPATASNSYVTRVGNQLTLDGQPYRFSGVNIYNANSDGWCAYEYSDAELGAAFDNVGPNGVVRAWFFQSQAASKSPGSPHLWSGSRDWTRFDRTLALAQQKGIRIIATLTDQWGECGDAIGGYKTDTWYGGPSVGNVRDASQAGYKFADPLESANPAPAFGYDNWVSYRDWVQEVVGRYANHPEVLAWQLINEGEAKTGLTGSCPTDATALMTAWAGDVSTLIRSLDPNHLISLGTIGTGQCGASFNEYAALHSLPNIDLCEFHDYTSGVDMPGDIFNGLQKRIDQCNVLGKPIFVGEVGIHPVDAGGTIQERAERLRSKILAQSRAGVVGHLTWIYNQRAPGFLIDCSQPPPVGDPAYCFDIGPTDPALFVLSQGRQWTAPWTAVERASVDSNGQQGIGQSYGGSLSSDGRYVAFMSNAALVSDDTNGWTDVFVRDRQSGLTERVSVAAGGGNPNQESYFPSISADGRYVAFESLASNLVPDDVNGYKDIFVHDRVAGTTERVNVASDGTTTSIESNEPSISADGRYVAFYTRADNLVSGDTNGRLDVFVHDRLLGVTELVSLRASGQISSTDSVSPVISEDGRLVAFSSSNLTPNASGPNLYLRDRVAGTTELVSVSTGGQPANDASQRTGAADITSDDRFVVFQSGASQLVAGDTNGAPDVFLRDRQAGTTERISIATGGAQGSDESVGPSIRADGRVIVFQSLAPNLVAGDTNGGYDVFARDRQAGTTERISVTAVGEQGNGFSGGPAISADGRAVVFRSRAANLVSGDTNGELDVLVKAASLGAPYAPWSLAAAPSGSGAIRVTWMAPPSDGGSGVTQYTITSAPGQVSASVGAGTTSAIVAGLSNGTAYTFVVRATNLFGTGPASAPSNPATPVSASIPGAPTAIIAAAGPETASVSWIPPADDGGSPITGYTVTPFPFGQPLTVSGATTTVTMGLVDDTTYTFTVTATNAVGTGPASAASSPVTPRANASPPTTVAEDVPVQGTISTDPANIGPTPSAPVTAAVTVPAGGIVTIAVGADTVSPPAGFSFLGQQVVINAPSATVAAPLTLVFTLEGSLVAGIPLAEIKVIRTENGGPEELANCTGAPTAAPDPCVADRSLVGGDVQITVLTSSASTWNLAIDTSPPLVTIDSVSRPFIGATGTSTVTWHANENGAYVVRRGGGDCSTGTPLASGSYATAPSPVLAAIQASALALGPNTIRVCVTDAALITGSTSTTIVKDITAPSVVSISLAGPSPTNAASVSWRVTFSEPVTGVGLNNFNLVQLGLGGAPALTGVAGGGTSWTVTASSGTGDWVTLLNLGKRTGIADLAGNPLANTLAGKIYQIDRLSPTVKVTRPAAGAVYTLGTTINASYACTDELIGSGIASCTATTSNGGPINTASVGPKKFTVVAVDRAGNSATKTVSYSVIHAFSGFFGSIANPPAVNSVKGGLSVSVTFSLSGNRGLAILAAGSPSYQAINCSTHAPTGAPTSAVGALSYSASTGRYTYAWQTSASWAGTCRQLTIVLNDGTSHVAFFRLTN